MNILSKSGICLVVLLCFSLTVVAQDVNLDAACSGKDAPFAPYADALTIHCDETFMYIEANSLADHDMMVGITAWNQQVPLPQPFHDENAWRVPLNPIIAETSTPTTGQGPIAVAINGVMIYNPTQQDGIYDENRDPFLIGELDTCGGHSGRADDYHYHIAPVCIIDELQELTEASGNNQPIAYALDGFPIYGFYNPDGTPPENLDECGGEFDEEGNYHYHARPEYPYVNGCFSGSFDMSLQPATFPIRPAGEPIRVQITDYYEDDEGWFHLEYDYQDSQLSISYRLDDEGCYLFEFAESTGTHTETYCQQEQPQRGDNPPLQDGNQPPPPPKPGQ